MASKPSSSAESDGLPWHGDFAGNATDGILLLIGGLLPAGAAIYVQAAYSDASVAGSVGLTNALRFEWY